MNDTDAENPTGPRAVGERAVRAALPGALPEGDLDPRDGGLGEELGEIGLTGVFGPLWARDGLGPRDCGPVTPGVLIARGAKTGLRAHARIAQTNGLPRNETAEAAHHAAGYADFPAADAARTAAREALAR